MRGRRRALWIVIVVVLVVVALAVQRLGPPRGAAAEAGVAPAPTVAVEPAEDGATLRGRAADGAVTFELDLARWRAFADARLEERLGEEVRIGEQPLPPSAFDRFGAAAPSPDGRRAAFTATAYALLTTASVVTVLDLESGELDVVDEVVFGDAEELIWSPDGRSLAMVLGTARARGDRFRVDDMAALTALGTFDGADVLRALDAQGIAASVATEDYLPRYRDPHWSEDAAGWAVVADDPREAEDGALRLLVDLEAGELRLPDGPTE